MTYSYLPGDDSLTEEFNLREHNLISLGKTHRLKVIRSVDFGVYLEGGQFGGILLPSAEVPAGCQVGDELEVFVYLDSDDYVIASTEKPEAEVGQFANLKVAEVNKVGAFLDWGMPKQLLLPYHEQRFPLKEGLRIVVRLYIDNSERIAASTKHDKFLQRPPKKLRTGEKVRLFIVKRTDIGFNVIVDDEYRALLHASDVFRTVRVGQYLDGYIKRQVEGKVDVMLDKPGFGKVEALNDKILKDLDDRGGQSDLGDKADPKEITYRFGCSKKAYKMAIGSLKKQGLIDITPEGIKRV